MKILLVEDQEMDRLLITRWLRPHEVIAVKCAAEAMPLIRDGFDAILCDMGLPDATSMTDNTTTVTEILAESHIPLIKVSGTPRDGVVDKTREAILEAIERLA